MLKFERELQKLINRTSQENDSNTPDWILAQYLTDCLRAFNGAVQKREEWHGRDGRPSEAGIDLVPDDCRVVPTDAPPAGSEQCRTCGGHSWAL